MLRTRVVAAVTASVLTLGMSLGGAGAAFAASPSNPAIATVIPTAPSFEPCTPRAAQPEITEISRIEFQRYSLKGDGPPAPGDIPPSESWQANTANKTGSHADDPVDVAFQRDNPGRGGADWFYWKSVKIVEREYRPAVAEKTCSYEVGLYVYKKTDPTKPASWPNSGPQIFITSKTGTDWFTTFPATLPTEVCGPGWAVQQDKVRFTGTFTWPSTIKYPNDNIGWPPIYAAKHNDLTAANYPGLVVPDCPPVEVQECVTPNTPTAITTLEGMYFETRSGGSQRLAGGGIEIATFGTDLTQAKSAGYVGLVPPIPFGEIGTPSMLYTVTSGASAGLNVTLTKNGAWFGNLVFEPLFDEWWINKAVPGMPAGPNPGYQLAYGSLDEFYNAFLTAGWTVNAVAVGYSLGSGAIGSGIVESLTIGCDTYTFGLPELPPLGVIPASASSVLPSCDVRTGSYTFGADGPDAGKIVWTVNGEPATPPTAPIMVTTTSTVVITAKVDPQFANTFGINASGTWVVDQQTGVYTWTLSFRIPTAVDCPTPIPVVDPFTVLDDCLLGQSYTLEFERGITYWVTVDPAGPEGPRAPVAVVFGPDQTEKTFVPQPGDFVSVTPVADEGYVLAPNQPTPLSHTFAVYGPNDCQLVDLPNWPASVSSTNQVCTPSGASGGSITVQFSTGPSNNPNPVRYYLAYGTPQERELTSATTSMPAGTYEVTAVVTDPRDSINDAGQSARFPVTVGAPTVSTCELDTLALTGTSGSPAWLGALAVLMTVAGVGFVLRRHRLEV